MKKYKYIGTILMAFTLGDNTEHLLQPGDEVELPSDNKHVKSLVASKKLEEVKPKKTA